MVAPVASVVVMVLPTTAWGVLPSPIKRLPSALVSAVSPTGKGIPGQPGADAVSIVGGLCHGAIATNSALRKLDIVTFVDFVARHQRWDFINMNAVGLGDPVVSHSREVKADAQAGKGKLVAVDGNFTAERRPRQPAPARR